MDDDGQHDPRGIFRLEKKILDGYDLVYAQFPKMEEAPLRRLGSLSLDVFLALFTKKPRGLRITSFLALSEPALLELKKYKSHHPFIGGWLFVHGYRAGGVLVRHRARETGRSNYTIKKLLLRAAELMFLFRLRPGKGSPPAFRIREIVGGYGKKNRAPSVFALPAPLRGTGSFFAPPAPLRGTGQSLWQTGSFSHWSVTSWAILWASVWLMTGRDEVRKSPVPKYRSSTVRIVPET